MLEALARGPTEQQVPARSHDRDRVAQGQAARGVGDNDHAATELREPSQSHHQPPLERRIKPACWLVEQQHRRLSDQLDPRGDTLTLPTRQSTDLGVCVLAQPQLVEYVVDRCCELLAAKCQTEA